MSERRFGCATEVAMHVLGGKWTVVLLAHLKEGDRRYAELRRRLPGISEKVLADRLRALTSAGLIDRTLVSATPPHVVYALNDRGRSLIPALQALHDWGRDWAEQQGLEVEELSMTPRPVSRGGGPPAGAWSGKADRPGAGG